MRPNVQQAFFLSLWLPLMVACFPLSLNIRQDAGEPGVESEFQNGALEPGQVVWITRPPTPTNTVSSSVATSQPTATKPATTSTAGTSTSTSSKPTDTPKPGGPQCPGSDTQAPREFVADKLNKQDGICDIVTTQEIGPGDKRIYPITGLVISGGDILDPQGCVFVVFNNTKAATGSWKPSKEECTDLSKKVMDKCNAGDKAFKEGAIEENNHLFGLVPAFWTACPPAGEIVFKPPPPPPVGEPPICLDPFGLFCF